jgi:hypothetical protein
MAVTVTWLLERVQRVVAALDVACEVRMRKIDPGIEYRYLDRITGRVRPGQFGIDTVDAPRKSFGRLSRGLRFASVDRETVISSSIRRTEGTLASARAAAGVRRAARALMSRKFLPTIPPWRAMMAGPTFSAETPGLKTTIMSAALSAIADVATDAETRATRRIKRKALRARISIASLYTCHIILITLD